VGVVDETIQDGVGIGGVADDAVPGGDGKLAGDDRRSTAVAVLEDFQEIVPRLFVERFETPLVEDQKLNVAQGALQPGVSSVAAGERALGEQPRDTLIENGPIVTASLVAKGAGQPALPTPEGPQMATLS
jgi:hypothetical protein